MPSLRPAAVAVTALLLAPAVYAGEVPPDLAGRYSIGRTVPAAPALTLLDPSWLLPPIESLDTAVAAADGAERADQILRDVVLPVVTHAKEQSAIDQCQNQRKPC